VKVRDRIAALVQVVSGGVVAAGVFVEFGTGPGLIVAGVLGVVFGVALEMERD